MVSYGCVLRETSPAGSPDLNIPCDLCDMSGHQNPEQRPGPARQTGSWYNVSGDTVHVGNVSHSESVFLVLTFL